MIRKLPVLKKLRWPLPSSFYRSHLVTYFEDDILPFLLRSLNVSVTDGVEGMCVDPGEMEAILEAGGVRGPSPPGGGKSGQLASDSGGG
jgi:hypothetical protein